MHNSEDQRDKREGKEDSVDGEREREREMGPAGRQ